MTVNIEQMKMLLQKWEDLKGTPPNSDRDWEEHRIALALARALSDLLAEFEQQKRATPEAPPEASEPWPNRTLASALTDPHVGDVVQGIWSNPRSHQGAPSILTVQARLGDMVASSDDRHEIRWQLVSSWCDPNDPWLKGWRTLSLAGRIVGLCELPEAPWEKK